MPTPGYIYVVWIGIKGLYKIGRTSNIQARMKSLTAANPLAQCIVATRVDDTVWVERHLHRHFKRYRVDREIFQLQQTGINWIQKFLDHRHSAGDAQSDEIKSMSHGALKRALYKKFG